MDFKPKKQMKVVLASCITLNSKDDSYPLIMAKESSLEKYEAPGRTVTVSLPERIRVKCEELLLSAPNGQIRILKGNLCNANAV